MMKRSFHELSREEAILAIRETVNYRDKGLTDSVRYRLLEKAIMELE